MVEIKSTTRKFVHSLSRLGNLLLYESLLFWLHKLTVLKTPTVWQRDL